MNGSAASSPGRKLKLAFVLFACVLLLVGITVIFPRVAPARAAGATLTVSPLVGIAGTSLTISGKAFGAGEIVKLYWNYTGPGTGTLLTTATGNSTGSFTVGATVPASAVTGPIPIAGVGQTSNTTASFNF